jgi:transcription antitermination factor NusG
MNVGNGKGFPQTRTNLVEGATIGSFASSPGLDISMHWYALRSKPNKEEALWRQIGGGHEVFYPYIRVQPVNPRARKMKPYFPGYLFGRLHHSVVGPTIFSWVPFVQGLVSFGGEPAEVAGVLMAALKARVDEINLAGGDGYYTRGMHAGGFKPGVRIVINGGPFAAYQAIFAAHLAGADRVRVLLELLRARPMKLELSAEQIQLTNRRRPKVGKDRRRRRAIAAGTDSSRAECRNGGAQL